MNWHKKVVERSRAELSIGVETSAQFPVYIHIVAEDSGRMGLTVNQALDLAHELEQAAGMAAGKESS